MLVREERILLDSMVKDCFCAEQFLLLFESISLYNTSLGLSIMVLFGLVVTILIFLFVLQNFGLR